MEWSTVAKPKTKINSVIHGIYKKLQINSGDKVAAFDLDHTLVIPANNKKFSNTDTDWIFIHKLIPDKVRKLHNKGFKIVIISNQKGISQGKVDENMFKKKIQNVATSLDVPLVFLASKRDDGFRKPMTGLWDCIINKKFDTEASFFCGDAGGLPKRKIDGITVNKDFSDSDLKFAYNLGMKFIHRDQFVYGVKMEPLVPKYGVDFNKLVVGKYDDFVSFDNELNKFEMVIMVGYPGSGKSYYATRYIVPHGYQYVNRDTLGTAAKCIKMVKQYLDKGKSVVVDNTNPSEKARKLFIDIAKQCGCKVRCVNFTTPFDLSMHNNIFRGITKDVPIVPKIAYNIYKKNYQNPTQKEGFYKIENIEFKLDPSTKLDEGYGQYLF